MHLLLLIKLVGKVGSKCFTRVLYLWLFTPSFTASMEYWNLNSLQVFMLLFAATMIMEFGHTIWLIFHRSYLFEFIPSDKRGSILGTISSIHKIFGVIAPLIAGIMAYRITPLSPFYLQFSLLIIAIVLYKASTAKSVEN